MESNVILSSLSTRELALVIWAMVALCFFIFNKSIRQSLIDFAKALFAWKISVSLIAYILYTGLWSFILFKFGLWSSSQIKDILIWLVSFGFISLMNINKVTGIAYFKKLLFDVIKWTIIVEFIVNFFNFSLIVELIIVPLLALSVGLQTVASLNPENKQVEKLFTFILAFLGISILLFSFYKTIEQYNELFTFDNFKSFLLPLILSITFLPFLYLYSLFVKYEELWMRLNFGIKNEQDRKRVKQQIFRVANFNINKLINISKNIAEPIYVYNDFSNNMIKAVSKGKYTDFFNK